MSHRAGGVAGTGAGIGIAVGVGIVAGSTAALGRDFLPRLFDGALIACVVELTGTTGATGGAIAGGVSELLIKLV